MSKLYEKYLELKNKDSKFYYLFKCGNFYIFLDDDAKEINKVTLLKLTKINANIVKCGFPINSLEKYMNIFKNLNLDIKIVKDSKNSIDKIIKKLKKIEINNITPLKALKVLKELQDDLVDV